VLKEEASHDRGENKAPSVDKRTQSQADEGYAGGIGLDGPLDVPLMVELFQAPVKRLRSGNGGARHVLLSAAANALVDVLGGVLHDTSRRFRDHVGSPLVN
jgi:hypothetical protein